MGDDTILNTCYWNVLFVAGFYSWELMLDELKPSILAHHLTTILSICSVFEWLEVGAAAICLPIVICDIVKDEHAKRFAMLVGAIAGTILYTVADAFGVHFILSSLGSMDDIEFHIKLFPILIFLGVVPLQVVSFARMFAIAGGGRNRAAKSNTRGRQVSPVPRLLRRVCSELPASASHLRCRL